MTCISEDIVEIMQKMKGCQFWWTRQSYRWMLHSLIVLAGELMYACLLCTNGMQVVIWYVRALLWTGRFPTTRRNRRGESSGSSPKTQILLMRTSGRSVKLHCVTTTTEVWLLSTCQPRAFKRQKHFYHISNNDFIVLSHLLVPWALHLQLNPKAYKVMSSWDLWAWADSRHLPYVSFTRFWPSQDFNRCWWITKSLLLK